MKKAALGLVILFLAVYGSLYFMANQGNPKYTGGKSVRFTKGTSTRELGLILAQAGVVRSPWHFWSARLLHMRSKIMAGDYSFDKPQTPEQIVMRLIKGEVVFYILVVPEGYNMFDIGKALESQGFFSMEDFVAQARNPAMILDLAPKSTSLEGFLFPSTYHLAYHAKPEQVCRMMTNEFRRQWKELGATEDPLRTVTLGSLVEKETGVKEERATVASVFENRLERGIKLDCDPTVAYAALLLGAWRGKIYKSDLNRNHPYNTYKVEGLPPGPIANPGLASLRAALKPAESKYIYFVAKADGTGQHNFAATLAEHRKNVEQYRRVLRTNK